MLTLVSATTSISTDISSQGSLPLPDFLRQRRLLSGVRKAQGGEADDGGADAGAQGEGLGGHQKGFEQKRVHEPRLANQRRRRRLAPLHADRHATLGEEAQPTARGEVGHLSGGWRRHPRLSGDKASGGREEDLRGGLREHQLGPRHLDAGAHDSDHDVGARCAERPNQGIQHPHHSLVQRTLVLTTFVTQVFAAVVSTVVLSALRAASQFGGPGVVIHSCKQKRGPDHQAHPSRGRDGGQQLCTLPWLSKKNPREQGRPHWGSLSSNLAVGQGGCGDRKEAEPNSNVPENPAKSKTASFLPIFTKPAS
mmetsp:Transcript_16753/g.33217  ORF Transcript_16753/g.33217 Transcript_16753/m.33217 type:complete len:309 (+) Transcript_16753:159-1085(+)